MATTVDATPARIDLKLYQGDDCTLLLILVDSATGDPVDVTGCVPNAEIHLTTDDATALATFTADIDVNNIYLYLANVDTATLTGPCVWDVQLTDAVGRITTVAYGKVTVIEQVTR
jgi:hypothetical protein